MFASLFLYWLVLLVGIWIGVVLGLAPQGKASNRVGGFLVISTVATMITLSVLGVLWLRS